MRLLDGLRLWVIGFTHEELETTHSLTGDC
jgi:hypothetical protein